MKYLIGLLVLVATVGLAAGCGSDDNSGNATDTTAAGGGDGEPVRIYVNVPVNTEGYSLDDAIAGAQAAARAINEDGGLNGSDVEIVHCNTQVDPNQEVACARQADSEGAVATVASYPVADGAGYQRVLTEAGIPDIANAGTVPEAFLGDNTFTIDFAPGNYTACVVPALAEAAGSEKFGSASVDVPAAAPFTESVKASAEHHGFEYVGDVAMPIQGADASSLVQQLDRGDPGTAVLVLTEPQVVPFVTAASGLGKDWVFCASPTIATGNVMTSLGEAASRFYQGSPFQPLGAAGDNPELQRFIDEMKAEEEAGNEHASTDPKRFSLTSLRAWLGVQIVKAAAEQIDGQVTRENLLEAMNGLTWDGLGIVPEIDFSNPRSAGDYKRVFNANIYAQRWDAEALEWHPIPDAQVDAVDVIYGN